ncbi:MAG TPA: ATP-binding protein [Clostridiales bacterium]|nr:ATP-binding protein [Clostridiales bacterium]
MIKRQIEDLINNHTGKGKAVIILGARQVGKTTVLEKMFSGRKDVLWLDGDEPQIKAAFQNISSDRLKAIIGDNKVLLIDEAQNIEEVGQKLKLVTDLIKDVQLIVSGSSSFELADKLNEPLTGRKREFNLYPVSYKEMSDHHGLLKEAGMLKHRLVYGYYPETVTSPGKEKKVLKELLNSYLYKDVLKWGKLKKSERILKLLQAIAFQVGNEVSYSELGTITGLDKQTVESYIQLLEQAFVVFRLGAFSRNLRKELSRSRKIYFFDNGIRNALINNFSEIDLREDRGKLWENFLISERIKYLNYSELWVSQYFWRTYDQQEIDYIEESDGEFSAYEFKWNAHKKKKIPEIFMKEYKVRKTQIITPENFEDFVGV